MKSFEVSYFVNGCEDTIFLEVDHFGQVFPSLEKILYQSELKSVYRIEEIYSHDDEKYADEAVDDAILNSYVGAPN